MSTYFGEFVKHEKKITRPTEYAFMENLVYIERKKKLVTYAAGTRSISF